MYILDPQTDSLVFTLKDGRDLGYTEYGKRDGFPVFYFHGFPGSRLEGKLLDIKLKKYPIRLIAVDRPGIGISSKQKKRTLLDWPKDIEELANFLNFDRFSILGISGGAPYALACAQTINQDRLVHVIIVSGMGPMKLGKEYMHWLVRLGIAAAKYTPWLVYLSFKLVMQPLFKTPKRTKWVLNKYAKSLIEEDKELFKDPKSLDIFVADNYYVFQNGILGAYQDLMLYSREWGFDLDSLPPDLPIYVLHGGLDDTVPIEMAENMVKELPNSIHRFYPNEGHYSTALNRLEELLKELLPTLNHQAS